MNWQAVATIPISIGVSISAERAGAIRTALLRRAVPVSRMLEGRLEPLATGSLVSCGGELGLLTAGHIFEHVTVGDLAIPLPARGSVARLGERALRVIVDSERDLALVIIGDRVLARLLQAHWTPVPLAQLDARAAVARAVYGLAGYPTGQTLRFDGCLFSKPVVVFTSLMATDRYAYARTAERVDGLGIHTPELEGVSGALIWSIDELEPDPSCVLHAVAMQIAFRHGQYVRAEPVAGASRLFRQAWAQRE